ncbi:hypothetical protein [Helicobacter sp. MIT 14-3879]|uniref:hypothetical protein n=1 Tax=Helicobacter sp. MIT 14-3879 TaxID=2040649 RepID=UPI000E1E2DC5|nr:hypothetical protein [Helicobacter sp. MIT 14-3879]RDU58877.1 hypothetical protein CQA44_11960 [Helicobacter sp. MIT 14-3879]
MQAQKIIQCVVSFRNFICLVNKKLHTQIRKPSNFIMTFFLMGLLGQNAICVPQHVLDAYDGICWQCYDKEISIQNFVTKYRSTLRNICYKKDAQACHILARVYAALGDDVGADEYFALSCKYGLKKDCELVVEDTE